MTLFTFQSCLTDATLTVCPTDSQNAKQMLHDLVRNPEEWTLLE